MSSWYFGEFGGVCGSALIVRDISLTLVKVSIIAKVVSVAFWLFNMVASIYKPFSVKAVGGFVLPPFIEVANCDFNGSHSCWVSSRKSN